MTDLVRLFWDNLLPVFLAAGAGYLLTAFTGTQPRMVARAAFFVFAPCLIYRIIVDNGVGGPDFLHMAGFAALSMGVPALFVGVVARVRRWPRPLSAAMVLVVLLPNAGNYGLSASLFAFGEPGLAQASLFFVTSSIVSYTLGVFVASLGRTTIWQAALRLPRFPPVWGVALGFLSVSLDLTPPRPVTHTVELLSDACIPVFLLVLGMHLRLVRRQRFGAPLVLVTVGRLAGGGAMGLLLAGPLGMDGVARQAGVLQSAMPSAVIAIILASEYDLEPEFVTMAVFTTTVLSPLVITPLLSLLGA